MRITRNEIKHSLGKQIRENRMKHEIQHRIRENKSVCNIYMYRNIERILSNLTKYSLHK